LKIGLGSFVPIDKISPSACQISSFPPTKKHNYINGINIITVTIIVVDARIIIIRHSVIINLFIIFKMNFFAILFVLWLILFLKGIFVPSHHQSAPS